jgi:hypothetical protein
MRKIPSLFLAGLLVFVSGFLNSAFAVDFSSPVAHFTGKAYEIGSNRSKLLFTLDRSYSADGKSGETQFKDLSGKLLVTEKMEFDGKGGLLSYAVIHHQTGTEGKVEAKGSKLVFTKGSSIKEEDLASNWVVGPTLIPMLSARWADILKGESLKVRLASWERQETIGFELFKDRVEKGPDGKDRIIIKMKPSSFIISALVKPLFFTMGMDGKSLDAMQGRVLPKLQDGSKWKDLDAEIDYSR